MWKIIPLFIDTSLADGHHPTVIMVEPAHNSQMIHYIESIKIVYDMEVRSNMGKSITVREDCDYTQFSCQDVNNLFRHDLDILQAEILDNIVTFPFHQTVNNGGKYNIFIPDGLVIGNSGTTSHNHSTSFYATDRLNPTITEHYPIGHAVSQRSDIWIEFDEPVERGSGEIEIFVPLFQETKIEMVTMTMSRNNSRVHFETKLEYNMPVVVRLHAGAFEDLSGNPSAETTWSFSTMPPPLTMSNNSALIDVCSEEFDPRSCFDKEWWDTCEVDAWTCSSPTPSRCLGQTWSVCGRTRFVSLLSANNLRSWFDTVHQPMRFAVARMFGEHPDNVMVEMKVVPNPWKMSEGITFQAENLDGEKVTREQEIHFEAIYSIVTAPSKIVHRFRSITDLPKDWRNFKVLTERFSESFTYYGAQVPSGFSTIAMEVYNEELQATDQNHVKNDRDTLLVVLVALLTAIAGLLIGGGFVYAMFRCMVTKRLERPQRPVPPADLVDPDHMFDNEYQGFEQIRGVPVVSDLKLQKELIKRHKAMEKKWLRFQRKIVEYKEQLADWKRLRSRMFNKAESPKGGRNYEVDNYFGIDAEESNFMFESSAGSMLNEHIGDFGRSIPAPPVLPGSPTHAAIAGVPPTSPLHAANLKAIQDSHKTEISSDAPPAPMLELGDIPPRQTPSDRPPSDVTNPNVQEDPEPVFSQPTGNDNQPLFEQSYASEERRPTVIAIQDDNPINNLNNTSTSFTPD